MKVGERDATKTALTAFEESTAGLRVRLKHAKLDPKEFERKLSRCSLDSCHGMCSVDDSTAAILQKLSIDRASEFRDFGLAELLDAGSYTAEAVTSGIQELHGRSA
jgi:hypothetical protein